MQVDLPIYTIVRMLLPESKGYTSGMRSMSRRVFALLVLCFVFLVTLSSCITLSPPGEQVGKELATEQEVSPDIPDRQVTWRSTKVNNPEVAGSDHRTVTGDSQEIISRYGVDPRRRISDGKPESGWR